MSISESTYPSWNSGILPSTHFTTFSWKLSITLRLWLDHLIAGGIDLLQYGECELRMHQQHEQISRDFEFRIIKSETYPGGSFEIFKYRLLTFKYGAKPQDWKFWLVEVGNCNYTAFCDFWELQEHPERFIPGAWIELRSDEDEQ